MRSVKDLFISTKNFSKKWEKYFDIYDEILFNYKNKKITVVEVGVHNCGSLEVWRKFLGSEARIIGIDANPDCKKFESEGYEIFIGDQTDNLFWESFFNKVGRVDILIDDGGHTNEQQIKTIVNCIKNINDGGLIITEDTHTSYKKEFGNPSKYSFISFAKKLVDDVNFTFPFESNKKFKFSLNSFIHSITFYESVVVFRVDRKKCYINKYTQNSGMRHGMKDFRNDKEKLIQVASYLRKKIFLLKNIKFQKINYFIKNFKFRNFFK